MSRRGMKPEAEPGSVASWVVSFGDMVTNLMACFVMMQAFATTQDKTLFNAGMGSYRRAVAQCGLPDWLFGKQDGPEFNYRKIKYPTPNDDTKDDEDRSRIIDMQEDQIRQAFARMNQAMETSGQQVDDKLLALTRLEVKYPPGGSELDDAGRGAISRLTAELRQGLAGRKVRLCVIGVVVQGDDDRGRWVLSARRARQAETYLRAQLAPDIRAGKVELISWGAGEGQEWCRRVGLDRPADSIILAITGIGANRG
jgi:flagellar motor protein MotB